MRPRRWRGWTPPRCRARGSRACATFSTTRRCARAATSSSGRARSAGCSRWWAWCRACRPRRARCVTPGRSRSAPTTRRSTAAGSGSAATSSPPCARRTSYSRTLGGGPMAVNPLSRRDVMKFGAFTTVGGVLTPGISLAQAIATDTRGILARDIELSVGGTKIPAYDARPERQGRYPVIVVISGFTGNTEQNKDVVRRFAQAGYYAIAPELYFREGGMQGKDFQQMSQISGKVTRAQYLGDLSKAVDYAKGQSWARADRLGVTGFCG